MSEALEAKLVKQIFATGVARGAWCEAEVALIEAKYDLLNAEYECYRNGIEGKNVEQRNAWLFELTTPLQAAEKNARIAALRSKAAFENSLTAEDYYRTRLSVGV